MKLKLTALFFVLSNLLLTAQSPALRVRYFTSADGILNMFVNHVAQDSTGYIWVATRNGLYRYNGYAFTGYLSKPSDSLSLTGNQVNYLFTDTRDRLWIATTNGLCFYNKKQDNFVRIIDQKKQSAGLPAMNINKIAEDGSGNILICNGNSIYRYGRSGKFSIVKTVNYTAINDFVIDAGNNIWLALDDKNGIIRFDPVKGTEDKIVDDLSVSRLNLKKDTLWIATLGQGVKMVNIKTMKVSSYPFYNNDDAMVINVITDQSGFVWTVDYTGLKIAHPGSATLTGYYPAKGDAYGLKSNVKGIFQDNQGNYWVYHEPGGLGISMRLKGFKHFTNNAADMWSTSSPNITAVREDASLNLWMGYHEGGIDVFDWQKGLVRRYNHDEKNKYSLGRGSVLCIFRDRQGLMWIGTYFDGLQYFDEKKDRFVSIPHDPDNINSPAGNDIRSIAEDQEGNLWIGVHSKGVDKFDTKNNKFEHFNNKNNKLSNDWPFQLIIDRNEDLWVATAYGLNLLKKGSSQFRNFFSVVEDTTSLSADFITSLYADDDNNIWVGTSMGLNLYNRNNNTFTQYKNVFGSDYICAILGDTKRNLWISTLSGLSLMTPGRSINNFDTSDGLVSNEFNGRSAYRSHRDEMFFGGTKGIDIFLPDKLDFNLKPPDVVLTRLSIFNKEITPSNSHILNNHISETKRIKLHHNDKVITIGFAAINYINTRKNQYAYRLEGFENEWHYPDQSREATYTNIDPGRYTFRVIASNNDGVWNMQGATLEITMLPPWYRTLFFEISAVALLFMAIWLFIKLRTANLEKKRLLLERTVEEKTASLVEANNQLIRYNNTKDKLFTLISHDLVSPFNTIIGFSEILKEGYDHLSETEKINYITMINESSEKVYVLLNNLLVWSRSQSNRITCNPGAVRLKGLIDEVLELNSGKLKVKDINVTIDCPDGVQVMADLEMLKTIIRNLISNAVKFTMRSGHIVISVKPESSRVNISVTDSGVGMSREKIDELLSETLIESNNGTEGESGTGFGLTICKDFIKRNNGDLHITSEPGKGSNFTISLPLVTV